MPPDYRCGELASTWFKAVSPFLGEIPACHDAMSRRTFVKAATARAVAGSMAKLAPAEERVQPLRAPRPSGLIRSGKQYDDPFNQVEVDAVVTLPSGRRNAFPAFWAGGSTWRVRYAPPAGRIQGDRSVCSDAGITICTVSNSRCTPNPTAVQISHYKHGALKIAADGRHFEHGDGTPFFWLGDTWWMGLCKRLSWPDGFESLTADRVKKGFTMVQIVAGLYPDMEPVR